MAGTAPGHMDMFHHPRETPMILGHPPSEAPVVLLLSTVAASTAVLRHVQVEFKTWTHQQQHLPETDGEPAWLGQPPRVTRASSDSSD